ncbi:glycyl-radical enzyme activating protein [Chloroflexota bacterium]
MKRKALPLQKDNKETAAGHIFNIQRCSFQDGPGIRTTVFFKGCPLWCLWCSNPESHNFSQDIGHHDSLCTECGRCMEICKPKCISVANKKITIDRAQCTYCGECVRVCSPDALIIWGRNVTVEEVITEIEQDSRYYQNGIGGVTASGGEPLSQPAFVKALFEECHARCIHTAIETSGYASPNVVKNVLEDADCILYDLKHMDSVLHEKYTGVPNELILDNLRTIAGGKSAQIILRIPLIPDVNDSEENITATVEFAISLNVTQIDLLTYHRLGVNKYAALDRPYELDISLPESENVKKLASIIEGSGLKCNIGG